MDSQRLREIFEKEGSYVIVVGQTYTLDEMGASLALYLTLTSRGKNVSIISQKQPLVEVSNLIGIDKVRPNYESKTGDLVVSFPYQEDEIGKVSYTLEDGFLNIIVKPKDQALSFGEKNVLFKRAGDVPQVLITVGVKRLSELSAMFNIEGLKDTTIVNIDRIGNNEGFGEVVIMGEGASSVSEQVANMLLTLGYPMDPDISQNLMSGLIFATVNFQSPRTSSLAFEMAGILLRNGAVRQAPRAEQVPSRPQPLRVPSMPGRQPLADPLAAVQPNRAPNQVIQAAPQALRSSSGQAEFPREQKKDEAPPDWLAPKIFKGSTSVE